MAILQTKEISIADLCKASAEDAPGTVMLPLFTRLRELRFPDSGQIDLVFDRSIGPGLGEARRPDMVISFTGSPQPMEPAADILDPMTGEVLVKAGAMRPALPALADLRAIGLSKSPQMASTFGELFDTVKRQIYLAVQQNIPDLAGGKEI
jgi:hypothetical protein